MTARSDAYDRRQRDAGEMTMVERVSEAVAKVVTHRLNMFFDEDSYDAIARAAIAAMRTPLRDEATLTAYNMLRKQNVTDINAGFNRVIDAALAEHDADSRENAGR